MCHVIGKPDFKYSCVPANFCDIKGIRYEYDYSNPGTLHNWVEDLRLECVSSFRLGLLGSAIIAGWAIGSIFIPRLGDVIGRKKVLFVSYLICNIVWLGLLLSRNLNFTTVLLFFFGFVSVGRCAVGFIYLIELTPKRYQSFIGSLPHIGNALIGITLTVYF